MEEKVSVLVIDDEEHIRDIVAYNLRADGFEVYLAENGRDGLQIAAEKKPDLVLLDWVMLETSGLEVLTSLKSDQSTNSIPVFMLTAKDMYDDVNTAVNMGADSYIAKPFDPTQLGKTIRARLGKYITQRQG